MSRIAVVALAVGALAQAATYKVCPAGDTDSSCTHSQSQAQSLFDNLACDDIVQFKGGAKYVLNASWVFRGRCNEEGKYITLTTDQPGPLPPDGVRITPAHLPHMPLFVSAIGDGKPIFWLKATDGATPPPSHYRMVGLAFTHSNKQQYWFIWMGDYQMNSLAGLPDDIAIDRCYFFGNRADLDAAATNAITAQARRFTLVNSFFEEMRAPGQENHAIDGSQGGGWNLIRNNYFNVAAISCLFGGDDPMFEDPDNLKRNFTIDHNYFYKAFKWFPVSPDYEQVGKRGYCFKNGLEFKGVKNAMLQYNMVENGGMECQGQYTGFSFTLRIGHPACGPGQSNGCGWCSSCNGKMPVVESYASTDGKKMTISKWSQADTSSQWNNFENIVKPWGAIGASFDLGKTWEWRKIAAYDQNTDTIEVDTPFSQNASQAWWVYVGGPNQRVSDITVQNNLIKNAGIGIHTLGHDPYEFANQTAWPGGGVLSNLVVRNNLLWTDKNLNYTGTSPKYPFNILNLVGSTWDHNTAVWDQDAQNRIAAFGSPGGVKDQGFVYTNNLHPRGRYGFMMDSTAQGAETVTRATDDAYPVAVQNNSFPGAQASQYEPCAGKRVCSNNYFPEKWDPKFVDEKNGDFRLAADSPYKAGQVYGGTENTDLGADTSKLPLIENFKIAANADHATIEYDVTQPLADQTGILEVSTDKDLINDLCGEGAAPCYKVIDDLDPVAHPGADLDTRAANRKAGLHRTWVLGNATPLAPGTTYYYRLMVGGVTKRGEFTTAPAPSGATEIPVQFDAQPSVAAVEVQFGTPEEGAPDTLPNTTGDVPCDSGCTVNLPVASGSPLYYRGLPKDSSGTIVEPVPGIRVVVP